MTDTATIPPPQPPLTSEMLEHLRAGIQYALGDLKADDSPSKK